MLQPAAFMVRLPAPRFRSRPSESDRLIPNPAALAERRPSGLRSRLPHRTVIPGGDPFAGAIEVQTAGRRSRFDLIESLAPTIRLERSDLTKQRKMSRLGNCHASRLALMEIHLGRWNGEAGRAFDDRD